MDFLFSFCNWRYLSPLKPGAIQESKLNVWSFVFVFVFVFVVVFCFSQVGAIQEGLANWMCGHERPAGWALTLGGKSGDEHFTFLHFSPPDDDLITSFSFYILTPHFSLCGGRLILLFVVFLKTWNKKLPFRIFLLNTISKFITSKNPRVQDS